VAIRSKRVDIFWITKSSYSLLKSGVIAVSGTFAWLNPYKIASFRVIRPTAQGWPFNLRIRDGRVNCLKTEKA
jgi:hypothetical protein